MGLCAEIPSPYSHLVCLRLAQALFIPLSCPAVSKKMFPCCHPHCLWLLDSFFPFFHSLLWTLVEVQYTYSLGLGHLQGHLYCVTQARGRASLLAGEGQGQLTYSADLSASSPSCFRCRGWMWGEVTGFLIVSLSCPAWALLQGNSILTTYVHTCIYIQWGGLAVVDFHVSFLKYL